MSNTPRQKSLALLFVFGAFLTGGAVGYTVERALSRSAPQEAIDRVPDEQAMRDELAKELNLSPSQRVIIDSAFDWRKAQYRAISQQYRPAADSVRDSARVLMMNAMDATQITAFKALVARNKRVADSTNRARENK